MKLVNFRPSLAIRSIFGVLIVVEPKQLKSPYPWSSVNISIKLGFISHHKFVREKAKYKKSNKKEDITKLSVAALKDLAKTSEI